MKTAIASTHFDDNDDSGHDEHDNRTLLNPVRNSTVAALHQSHRIEARNLLRILQLYSRPEKQ